MKTKHQQAATGARERVTRSVSRLSREAPFYTSTLYPLVIKEEDVPTAATNGRDLIYNPKFVDAITDSDLDFVLLHETGHIVLRHFARHTALGKVDWQLWNQATDYAVNDLLAKCGRKIRKGFLLPGRDNNLPIGLSAEEYYRLLVQKQEQKQEQQQQEEGDDEEGEEAESETGGGDQGEEDPGEGSSVEGPVLDEGDDADGGEGAAGADDAGDADHGEDSSAEPEGDAGAVGGDSEVEDGSAGDQGAEAADGVDSEDGTATDDDRVAGDGDGDGDKYELPPEEQWGEVRDFPGEYTQEEQAKDDTTIAQAAMICAEAGTLPGPVKELVDAMLAPTEVPWTVILRRYLKATARDGRSYRRVNRRHGWRKGVIMPSRFNEGLGHIVLINDTSGSRDASICNKALEEVQEIVKGHPQGKITVIQCDAMVRSVDVFKKRDFPIKEGDVRTVLHGRGGTNMRPAFDLAKTLRPDVILCATDGEMSWPTEIKEVPTIWLMSTKIEPPWGHPIYCHTGK